MTTTRHTATMVAAALMAVLLSACDKVFDVHPYDVRLKGEKGINAKQAALIEKATLGKDTIRFAFISDTHQWFDETKAEIRDINRRKDSIDFVVHGGDITDFGGTREFEWSRDLLKGLSVPFVTLLGNHDCLGTGNQSYEVIFGDPDFSFIAGGVKFVCLNTNAIEYDYSRPVPNLDFMEQETTKDGERFDRTVLCMHAPPYSEQFNNNVAKAFNFYTKMYPRLLFCLYGHGHQMEQHRFFDDGPIYYEVCNAPKRHYYIFTITHENYSYEIIDF